MEHQSHQQKIDRMFEEGMKTLEYGSDNDHFNNSANVWWRLQGRRVLHLAHCIEIACSDDSIESMIFDIMEDTTTGS